MHALVSSAVALALLAAPEPYAQDDEDIPVLRVGEAVQGKITNSDAPVFTETLERDHGEVLGKLFLVEVEETGPYHLDLRSNAFDTYLVLRDEYGEVLAEDDDGLFWSHSRLVVEELRAGATYCVEACAKDDARGAFELHLIRGAPQELSPDEHSRQEAVELIRIVEARLGSQTAESARELHNRAYSYHSEGAFDAARLLYERALEIREQVLEPEDADIARSLSCLATVHHGRGDGATARPFYERALVISEKTLGEDHIETAKIINNLAILLRARGDDEAALPMYERALAIHERVLGPEHRDTANCLNNLANLLKFLGDHAAARPLLERAIAIRERIYGADHPDTAVCISNLANLLRAQGDYAAAQPLYERALAIQERVNGKEHPLTAESCNNLAVLLWNLGDYPASRRLFERAIGICERTFGAKHPHTASALNNLAICLESQGDHAAARPAYERAHAIYEETLGPEHPFTALSLCNLAVLFVDQGDHASARPLHEQALAIREKVLGVEHPSTAESLHSLAILLADTGELRAARDHIHRARMGTGAHIKRLLASMSEGEAYRLLAVMRVHVDLELSLAPLLDDPGLDTEAYDSFLQWKGQVGRLMTASRGHLVAAMTDEQRSWLEQLRSTQRQLSQLTFSGEIRDAESHDRRLTDLRAERNRLELRLQRSLEAFASEPLGREELRASLPDRSAYVDFFVHRRYRPARFQDGALIERGEWFDPELSVWITRAEDQDVRWRNLGPTAPIEREVRVFLEDLAGARGADDLRGVVADDEERGDASQILRALLWDPLVSDLEGIDTIFVSPDDFLGMLPLETLVGEDGHYLVERLAFVYVPDAASFARRGSRTAGELDSLLSTGGVDFQNRDERAARSIRATSPTGSEQLSRRGGIGTRWNALPATVLESQVVIDLHASAFREGGRLLLQGAAATEERLKLEMPAHRVLHLATHGFFQPEGLPSLWAAALFEAGERQIRMRDEGRELVGLHPGLLSGLVCAGGYTEVPEGREEGFLTAEVVGWLDLSGVDLVVLSACETALGETRSGEGMIGLRRAFQTAGAKTVISSLWSVKDESTSELMQAFYENLWLEGMGKGEALRRAQLDMLERNRSEHGDGLPSTWGAFVLSGDWR